VVEPARRCTRVCPLQHWFLKENYLARPSVSQGSLIIEVWRGQCGNVPKHRTGTPGRCYARRQLRLMSRNCSGLDCPERSHCTSKSARNMPSSVPNPVQYYLCISCMPDQVFRWSLLFSKAAAVVTRARACSPCSTPLPGVASMQYPQSTVQFAIEQGMRVFCLPRTPPECVHISARPCLSAVECDGCEYRRSARGRRRGEHYLLGIRIRTAVSNQ
jgi:hypothetical protein